MPVISIIKTPHDIKLGHIDNLLKQIEMILIEGKKEGLFDIEDCSITARSLFHGTARYHHPVHAKEWSDEHIKEDFEQLFKLFEKAIQKR